MLEPHCHRRGLCAVDQIRGVSLPSPSVYGCDLPDDLPCESCVWKNLFQAGRLLLIYVLDVPVSDSRRLRLVVASFLDCRLHSEEQVGVFGYQSERV